MSSLALDPTQWTLIERLGRGAYRLPGLTMSGAIPPLPLDIRSWLNDNESSSERILSNDRLADVERSEAIGFELLATLRKTSKTKCIWEKREAGTFEQKTARRYFIYKVQFETSASRGVGIWMRRKATDIQTIRTQLYELMIQLATCFDRKCSSSGWYLKHIRQNTREISLVTDCYSPVCTLSSGLTFVTGDINTKM